MTVGRYDIARTLALSPRACGEGKSETPSHLLHNIIVSDTRPLLHICSARVNPSNLTRSLLLKLIAIIIITRVDRSLSWVPSATYI